MSAIYPGNVAVFSTKVDLQDTVFAAHVNALQDEVTATQTVLGTGVLSSTWSSQYSNPTSHSSLANRLLNIEGGLRTLENSRLSLSGGTLTGSISGTSAAFTGSVSAGSLTGSGAQISGLNATNISSGTLNSARLPDSGIAPGAYAKVTVDSKGRAIDGGPLVASDLPANLQVSRADRWSTARTVSLTGAVTGQASVDGSQNVTLATTMNTVPVDFTPHFLFLGGM